MFVALNTKGDILLTNYKYQNAISCKNLINTFIKPVITVTLNIFTPLTILRKHKFLHFN